MGNVSFLAEVEPELFSLLSNIALDTDLISLAKRLLNSTKEYVLVQPAGSPAFHATLGMINVTEGFNHQFMFAYSKRVSSDVEQPDGTVRKTVVFRHEGWVHV